MLTKWNFKIEIKFFYPDKAVPALYENLIYIIRQYCETQLVGLGDFGSNSTFSQALYLPIFSC